MGEGRMVEEVISTSLQQQQARSEGRNSGMNLSQFVSANDGLKWRP